MLIRNPVSVLLLVLFAAAWQHVHAAVLGPGDHAVAMKHGGRERSVIVHVPPNASAKSQLAVAIAASLAMGR